MFVRRLSVSSSSVSISVRTMQHVDLIAHARYVLPVQPDEVIHERSCVVVHEGIILAILPSSEVHLMYTATEEVHLDDHVLMPGLVNAHTHAGMTLLRGYAEDLPLAEWLMTAVWPTEARLMSPGYVRTSTELAIAEMIKSGTTCFFEMYFHHDVTCEVVLQTGIRALVGLTLLDFPTAYATSFDDYFKKALDTYNRFQGHPLLTFAMAPHAPYTVSDDNLARAWKEAERLDISMITHLHETVLETQDSEEGRESMTRHRSHTLCRPLANFNRLDMVGPRLIAAHMTQLINEEIALVAETNSNVVHCPESNMKLVSGICPVHKLLTAGANVALGTDSACSNNDLSLFGEMRTASLVGKLASQNGTALKGATAIRLATINGARAARQERVYGSLEVGKSADMIAVSLKGVQHHPIYHLVTHLTYNTESSQVTDSWVAGKRLMKNRELTTIDEAALIEKAQRWQEIIADQSAKIPDDMRA